MYTILILDKNKEDVTKYQKWIWEIKKKVDVVHFDNAKDALQCAQDRQIDLFLLSGSDGDGLQVARSLRQTRTYAMTFIVFISSGADNPDRELEELHCYRDLKCMHYFSDEVDETGFKKVFLKPLRYHIKETKKDYIKLFSRDEYTRIHLDKVIWVEIEAKNITIYGKHSALLTVSANHYTLDRLEEALGEDFMRIQQSVIVSKDHVSRVNIIKRQVHVIPSNRSANEIVFKIGSTYVGKVKEQWS